MANINLSRESHVDYVGTLFFNALKVIDTKFTPKVVKVGETYVPLIHVDGVQTISGAIVNVDMWPRNNATTEDLDKMFKRLTHIEKQKDNKGNEVEVEVFDGYGEPAVSIDEIQFRIGYWPYIDENGEAKLREGAPKWLLYRSGNKFTKLSGEKREFGE